MQIEKFTFFGSFYEAMLVLPEEDRTAFVMGILAYAFEGKDPGFEGGLAAMFALAKPNIDSSIKGRSNGGKGGRPAKGKNPSENPRGKDEKPPEKPPEKTTSKTNRDRNMDREWDRNMERIENFSSEKNSLSAAASGGADAQGAPPAAPSCPMCGSPLKKTGMPGPDYWWCDTCRDHFPEGKESWDG